MRTVLSKNLYASAYSVPGIRSMSQETVAQILAIEQNAARKHDEAQQQAADLVAEAEKAADLLYQQELKRAHQQAEEILTAGKEKAEVERARIIAQAGADAQLLDTLAANNLEHAVDFVLSRIMGRT